MEVFFRITYYILVLYNRTKTPEMYTPKSEKLVCPLQFSVQAQKVKFRNQKVKENADIDDVLVLALNTCCTFLPTNIL